MSTKNTLIECQARQKQEIKTQQQRMLNKSCSMQIIFACFPQAIP